MNVIGSLGGEHALLPASLYKTIKAAYPFVSIYQIAGAAAGRPQNLIFIASTHSALLPDTTTAQGEFFTRVPEHIIDGLEGQGVILTDDFAPVEKMSQAIREMRFGGYR